MADTDRVIENINAMGSIATGIRSSEEAKEIFRLFLENKITSEEAKRRLSAKDV